MTYEATDRDGDGDHESFGTHARNPHAVVYADEDFNTWAVGPGGVISEGNNAETELQNAIDFTSNAVNSSGVGADAWGIVQLHGRYDISSSQITLKDGVLLNGGRSGELVNGLAAGTPVMHIEPGGWIGWLRVDANSNAGVSIGSANTQQNTYINRLDIVKVGAYTGLDVAGYQTVWNQCHVTGDGNYDMLGIDISDTSDLYGGHTIVVSMLDGMKMSTNEHIYLPALDFDSGDGTALIMDDVHDCHVNATAWVNQSSDSTLQFDYALDVGSNSTSINTHNVHANILAMKSGVNGIRLNHIDDSRIDAVISNREAYPAAPSAYDKGLIYGGNVGDQMRVDVNISEDTTTAMVDGTPAGILNGYAYEAAGAGNPPTAGKWPEHQAVENTDDNTFWVKNAGGTMTQLG